MELNKERKETNVRDNYNKLIITVSLSIEVLIDILYIILNIMFVNKYKFNDDDYYDIKKEGNNEDNKCY